LVASRGVCGDVGSAAAAVVTKKKTVEDCHPIRCAAGWRCNWPGCARSFTRSNGVLRHFRTHVGTLYLFCLD
jgi:hypothetical protein